MTSSKKATEKPLSSVMEDWSSLNSKVGLNNKKDLKVKNKLIQESSFFTSALDHYNKIGGKVVKKTPKISSIDKWVKKGRTSFLMKENSGKEAKKLLDELLKKQELDK